MSAYSWFLYDNQTSHSVPRLEVGNRIIFFKEFLMSQNRLVSDAIECQSSKTQNRWGKSDLSRRREHTSGKDNHSEDKENN